MLVGIESDHQSAHAEEIRPLNSIRHGLEGKRVKSHPRVESEGGRETPLGSRSRGVRLRLERHQTNGGRGHSISYRSDHEVAPFAPFERNLHVRVANWLSG